MENSLCVLLLVTGFCFPCSSLSESYYFVSTKMDWDEARFYCESKYTELVQLQNRDSWEKLKATQKLHEEKKVWIGLYKNASSWIWQNEKKPTFLNWAGKQPDNVDGGEFCASINPNGSWVADDCLSTKQFVCFNETTYVLIGEYLTWRAAEAGCEEHGSHLASVYNHQNNSDLVKLLDGEESIWIGLHRPEVWYWSKTETELSLHSWADGEPNVQEKDSCAAVWLNNGTWTDELCMDKHPFFCYGSEGRKTVLKVKIQTSANMEDPSNREKLLQQMKVGLVNRGMSDVKLSWTKFPTKSQDPLILTADESKPQENSQGKC